MGIRNCLEQNLLENKEQKEDVTRAWLMFYMVSSITTNFRTKEALYSSHRKIFYASHVREDQ